VGLYSVESVADSSADESTEVSGESLLTDPTRSIPEPTVYKAQPLESKILSSSTQLPVALPPLPTQQLKQCLSPLLLLLASPLP